MYTDKNGLELKVGDKFKRDHGEWKDKDILTVKTLSEYGVYAVEDGLTSGYSSIYKVFPRVIIDTKTTVNYDDGFCVWIDDEGDMCFGDEPGSPTYWIVGSDIEEFIKAISKLRA